MKLSALLIFLFFFLSGKSQVEYNEYFTGERLRFDFVIAGSRDCSNIYPYRFVREPKWGGPVLNLTDTFRYGELFAEIIDTASGKVVYSKGFSSLFKEWQLTEGPSKGDQAYLESFVMPFPKVAVTISISERLADMNFRQIFSFSFDPLSTQVEAPNRAIEGEYRLLKNSGDTRNNVDLVIVGEGYTIKEKKKFFEDANESLQFFFNWEPYKKYADRFNIHALFLPSPGKGADIPGDSAWQNTPLNASFYTFGSERYLTSRNNMTLHEAVAYIPYDQVCMLVNTDKYGGGGVYNAFTVFCSDDEYSGFLFIHEFGHAFASLGDEYYTSPTAYDESVNLTTEPYQPNITTNITFEKKWKNMISDTVPIPTPNDSAYADVIGMFEGAAYQGKGIYRPAFDCAMKSKTYTKFCPVCQVAIENMILFYCDE